MERSWNSAARVCREAIYAGRGTTRPASRVYLSTTTRCSASGFCERDRNSECGRIGTLQGNRCNTRRNWISNLKSVAKRYFSSYMEPCGYEHGSKESKRGSDEELGRGPSRIL